MRLDWAPQSIVSGSHSFYGWGVITGLTCGGHPTKWEKLTSLCPHQWLEDELEESSERLHEHNRALFTHGGQKRNDQSDFAVQLW